MYRLATCFWVSLRTLSPQGLSIAPLNAKDTILVGLLIIQKLKLEK